MKFGRFSTRYKDIFDLFYLSEKVDFDKLKHCFEFYIYSDPDMRENSIEDIRKRVNGIFENQAYINMLKTTDKNWLEEDVNEVVKGIESFLESEKFVDCSGTIEWE